MSTEKDFKSDRASFFSVAFNLVLTDAQLPYNLYINSSSNVKKERFVRIFPVGGVLSKDDVATFKKKYHQLYIPEEQRGLYLKSLAKSDNVDDVVKTEIIKDSAIGYLDSLFDTEKEFTTDFLHQAVEGCRDSVESMVDVIKDYDISKVRDLIANLSFHDFYTFDHSINVAMYCISIYRQLEPNAPHSHLMMAGLGGMLHDLGKIKIPTTIINNPGSLSDEDFAQIKKHPGYGGELIEEQMKAADVNNPEDKDIDFNVIKRVVMEHHENYNGTGYPSGLKGKEIHVMARITAIADFFDALTTKRSYHEALSTDDALAVMGRSAGKKIDPKLFELFTETVNTMGYKGKTNIELPEDFDPCQPCNVLPFQTPKPQVQSSDFIKSEKPKDFGKIKTEESAMKKDADEKKKLKKVG